MTALPDSRTVSCQKFNGSRANYMTPVSPASDWVEIHADCSDAVTDPNDPVTEAAANADVSILSVANGGTMMLLRCIYDAGETLPTVRVYGFDGAHRREEKNQVNANPMNLKDSDGNIAIVFTEVAATDVDTEAGRQATEPVQIDLLGSSEVVALATVASTAGVTLEAKIL